MKVCCKLLQPGSTTRNHLFIKLSKSVDCFNKYEVSYVGPVAQSV